MQGVGEIFCVAGRSHCACGTRERYVFDVLSLSLNKESTKESQPGRSLRDLPSCARKLSVLSTSDVFAKSGKFRFCVRI